MFFLLILGEIHPYPTHLVPGGKIPKYLANVSSNAQGALSLSRPGGHFGNIRLSPMDKRSARGKHTDNLDILNKSGSCRDTK